MSKFVFINAFAGKSKDKQKPFNKVSIAGIESDGKTRVFDLFTKDGVLLSNQETLRFGDVVKPTYQESDYPGGRPSLIGLEVLQTSPYSQN
ncbi:MAG: hypothetical protein K2L12_02715 [Clostridia bacterium]|nr:hypothetical protein [Clostridia bacterium]